jgi:hypothetical protein
MVKGPHVPGLTEIIPSRSDYKHLVSYRTYRLEDISQRFDPSVTKKLSSYAKRLKHSIEESSVEMSRSRSYSFSEPSKRQQITIVWEKALPRDWCPIFSSGWPKRPGYRAQMDEAPSGMPKYPFVIHWILETYALDDELSKAYMAATIGVLNLNLANFSRIISKLKLNPTLYSNFVNRHCAFSLPN